MQSAQTLVEFLPVVLSPEHPLMSMGVDIMKEIYNELLNAGSYSVEDILVKEAESPSLSYDAASNSLSLSEPHDKTILGSFVLPFMPCA